MMRKSIISLLLMLIIILSGINSTLVFAIDWPEKETNNPLKEWKVEFNQPLDENTLNNTNLYSKYGLEDNQI